MNFFQIIDQLSEVDPDVLDRFDSRRAVFSSLGKVARNSALAATPLFLSALFQKAYAGTTSTATDILQYALTLELLEQDFYKKVIASAPFAGTAAVNQAAINQIKKHEDSHVALLNTAISGLGGKPITGITFKAATFKSLADFPAQLRVAQLLEDTGVRAYKGRAVELLGTALLTTALQIHSVEARHAAHIRLLRGQRAWVSITNDDLATDPTYGSGVSGPTSTATPFGYGIPAYTTASPTESNVTQSNLPIPTAFTNQYNPEDAAAAFDEYLQAAEVLDASRAGGLAGA